MSHEIRTPLNAIVGFSQLLTTEEDPEVRKEYNDIVSLNNGLLLQIISDVLDLSRIESGHADLVRTRFDLRTLCREAVETFRLQTPEEVVLDVEKGLPSCTVCQYRQGLMQILANFIRNALKFTPKGFVTVGFERKRDRLSHLHAGHRTRTFDLQEHRGADGRTNRRRFRRRRRFLLPGRNADRGISPRRFCGGGLIGGILQIFKSFLYLCELSENE